jgi:peptidylprolyl isomerase
MRKTIIRFSLFFVLTLAMGTACNKAESEPTEGTEGESAAEGEGEGEEGEEGGEEEGEEGEEGGEETAQAEEEEWDPLQTPSDVAAPPEGAEVTASGLASRVIRAGDGTTHPGPTTRVTVNYSGWTTDGVMFDSSFERGETSSFGLNQVIAGWTEGLQLMVTGEARRFWIPEALAYGGQPGRPAGMLVFDVQLISF